MSSVAERVGVAQETFKEITMKGRLANAVCGACQVPFRMVPLRGVEVYGCARCGVGFVTEAARLRLLEGKASLPNVPAVREPRNADRWRWALAPVAAMAAMAVPTWIALKNPLLVSSTTMLAAIAFTAPAPTALLVHAIVPQRKALFGVLTAVVCAAVVGLTAHDIHAQAPVLTMPLAVAIALGLGFAIMVTMSRFAAKRFAISAIVSIGIVAAANAVHGRLEARAIAGCPDGARWSNSNGRHCERAPGLRHGPGETVLKGVLVDRGQWVDGAREGDFVVFHANGKKRGEGAYSDDLETGPWLLYGADGRLESTGVFANGLREGVWTTFDTSGAPRAKTRYVHGRVEP